MLYVTGAILCRLMRRHHLTIRLLAQRLDIPMTRVRRRRQEGIDNRHVARDWIEAITGQDPGMLHAPVEGEATPHARGAKEGKIHYLRRIKGRPEETWIHCGLPSQHVATADLSIVTCRRCCAYVEKGLAYGFVAHGPSPGEERQRCHGGAYDAATR